MMKREENKVPLPSTFPRCANHLSLEEFKVEAKGVFCHACVERSVAPLGARMFRCQDLKCPYVLCTQCARPRFQYAPNDEHPDHLTCPVCLDVLWEPAQHHECGNSFCMSCLESVAKTTGACPLCKASVDIQNKACISRVLLKNFTTMLDNVRVNCSICRETFERGRILHHELQVCLSSCSQGCAALLPLSQHTNHFLQACPMTKLPCRQGCGQQVRRGQMESHIDTECTFLVVCPQGCPAALPRFQFKQHIATCPNVSVPCSRGCQTQVPRCFLASHLELQCLVAVPCPQSCGLALPQKDFGTHAAMCVEVSVPCMAWEFECAFVGPRRLLADHERACAVVVLLPALKRMCGVVNSQRTLIEGLTQEQAASQKLIDCLTQEQAASQKRIESLAQEKVAANKLIDGLIEEQAALAKRLAALTQQQELYRAESEAQFKFQHVRIQQMEVFY
jgi:hypothetical protein